MAAQTTPAISVSFRCVGCLSEFCEECATNPKHPRIKACPECGDTALPAKRERAYPEHKAPLPESAPPSPRVGKEKDITAASAYLEEFPAAMIDSLAPPALLMNLIGTLGILLPFTSMWAAGYFTSTLRSAARGETGLGTLPHFRFGYWFWMLLSYLSYPAVDFAMGLLSIVLPSYAVVIVAILQVLMILAWPMSVVAMASEGSPWILFRPVELLEAIMGDFVNYVLFLLFAGLQVAFLWFGVSFGLSLPPGVREPIVGLVVLILIPYFLFLNAHLLGRLSYHSKVLPWSVGPAYDPDAPQFL